jgi:hypothetical protein
MKDESYDAIRAYWELKEDVFFPFSNKQVADFPHEEASIKAKAEKFTIAFNKLKEVSKEDIDQCVNNVNQAIRKILEIISASKLGYPLARDQGLIIENYVYGKILSVIMGAVKSPLGYGYPNFYYERDGDFNAKPLMELLKRFQDEINAADFATYLDFAKVYEKLKEDILTMWRDDNRRKYGRDS